MAGRAVFDPTTGAGTFDAATPSPQTRDVLIDGTIAETATDVVGTFGVGFQVSGACQPIGTELSCPLLLTERSCLFTGSTPTLGAFSLACDPTLGILTGTAVVDPATG